VGFWLALVAVLPLNNWLNERLWPGKIAIGNIALLLCFASVVVKGDFGGLPHRAVALLGLYALAVGISCLFVGDSLSTYAVRRTYTIWVMVFCLWMSSKMCSDYRTAIATLLTLIGSCTVLAMLSLNDSTAKVFSLHNVQRVAVDGYNENNYAFYLVAGWVSLLLVTLFRISGSGVWKLLAIGPGILLLSSLAASGSRGMMLAAAMALFLGCLAPRRLARYLAGGVALAAVLLCAYGLVRSDDSFRTRWNAAIENGELAGRQDIYQAAVDMFMERPMFGWGVAANFAEIASRVRPDLEIYSTHNSPLCVLTEVGVIGGAGYFAALVACGFAAWRARSGPVGLGSVMLFCVLVTSALPNDQLENHVYWILMGVVLASPGWVSTTESDALFRPRELSEPAKGPRVFEGVRPLSGGCSRTG